MDCIVMLISQHLLRLQTGLQRRYHTCNYGPVSYISGFSGLGVENFLGAGTDLSLVGAVHQDSAGLTSFDIVKHH